MNDYSELSIMIEEIIKKVVDDIANSVAEKIIERMPQPKKEPDEWVLHLKEAAKIIGVSDKTMSNYRRQKRFAEAFKSEGGLIRVNITVFNELYGNRKRKG